MDGRRGESGQVPSIFVLGSVVMACSAKVQHLPSLGESLLAEAFTFEVGGKGLNLALGAARLGARVDGILPLGDDPFGRLVENTCKENGLSKNMVLRLPAQTGSGIGFADCNGDNCLAVFPGANSHLSAVHVRAMADRIAGSDLVLAQFELTNEPILEAFAIAREAGRKTLLTPSPFRRIDPSILAHTSIIVLNRIEARRLGNQIGACAPDACELTPETAGMIVAALHKSGVETVIITLGSDGALAYRHGFAPVEQPAFAVTAVDTLGAGDAFTAGFAVGLIQGQEFAECLRRAAASAAITVQATGVFDTLPRRDRVDDFLAAPPPCRLRSTANDVSRSLGMLPSGA
jgi:ribokinase